MEKGYIKNWKFPKIKNNQNKCFTKFYIEYFENYLEKFDKKRINNSIRST